MSKGIKIFILLLIAVAWMTTIFKLSGMNSQNSNGKSTDFISIFIEDTLDITNEYGITHSTPSQEKLDKASELINAPMRKVIHASVYFVLAFFMMTLINIILNHNHYAITLMVSLFLCVAFAASDEFHQTFVNGRTGQILDVIIDSAGAVCGILFFSTYHLVYKAGFKKGKEYIEQESEIEEENDEVKIENTYAKQ